MSRSHKAPLSDSLNISPGLDKSHIIPYHTNDLNGCLAADGGIHLLCYVDAVCFEEAHRGA